MLIEMPEPDFPRFVGYCIYCNATDGLTDEHIIPFSLGGTWVLRKASCPRCKQITENLERRVAREDLIALRTVGKFPTYHPKKRPSVLPQSYSVQGERKEVALPPSEHPAAFTMVTFDPPAFLTGQPPPTIPNVPTARTFARRAQLQQLGRTTGATGLSVALPDRAIFARFLAKVALGFAAASPGLEAIGQVFVRSAILGQSDDVANWVGCVLDESFCTGTGVHELVSVVRNDIVEVAVRLFASISTPEYRIVVGSSREVAA